VFWLIIVFLIAQTPSLKVQAQAAKLHTQHETLNQTSKTLTSVAKLFIHSFSIITYPLGGHRGAGAYPS